MAVETSKELKKRMEEASGWSGTECQDVIPLGQALGLINEFEAHWKGEADRLDDGHAKTCKCCNCFVASIYRRILGEEKK